MSNRCGFAQMLLPVLPPGSLIVLDNALFHQFRQQPDLSKTRAVAAVPTGLLSRPQPHRTSVGGPENPSSQRPRQRHTFLFIANV
jgi:predicted O-methyltransferase YrrM